MSGLSPATFGYEKDAYMNTANVDLSANASEMTIESIKVQITNQLNRLFENIVKLQRSQADVTENLLDENMEWDFGDNERLDDQKKMELLKEIEKVADVPYEYKMKIIAPLLKKLSGDEVDKKLIKDIMNKRNEERKGLRVTYGEL